MRVLIHLDAAADAKRVAARLRKLSGATVRLPAPELPGVMLAIVEDASADTFVAKARDVRGVRHVELDSFPLSS
jgi:hypothetical protein